jgi:hypothetical protein
MTTRQYSSRSQQSTLTAAITSGATSITVVSGTGLLGGVTIPAGRTFTLVIDPDTALEEIVDATAVSTNTFTVTRAIDGSTAQDHSAGAVVRHMAIGRDFRDANLHAEATTAYNDGSGNSHTLHGIASGEGDIVATSKTQTLTNKTLTSPTITGTGTIAGTFTGNLTGNVTGNVTGNASTATALATARDFQITGDVEAAAVSFNGTAGVTLTAAIASGVIVNADVNASAAIDKTKISGTAVTLADSGTVTSTMIANDTIVNADINSAAAIAKTKLDLSGQITSADIADGAIVNTDIASTAAIAISKLAVDPLDRANHTGTQTAATISDFNTAVRTNRLDQMTAPTTSVSMNSQKLTSVADPTSNQDAVTLKYLTDQKGANNGIASLDGTGKVPSSQLPAIAVTHTFVVASQAAMLALSADQGDVAVRTDVNKSFILTTEPASTLANWQELLTPTDSVLSVDGQTGAVSLSGTYLNRTSGALLGNLDADGFKVVDLGTPTNNADAATKAYVDAVAGSATAAASSAAAAAATYDEFDDRYLGAKATPPTVDNDGNPLLTGALYWNTVDNAMYAWSGSEWGSISSTAAIYRYRYTAAGGETSESGADDNGNTLSYLPGKEQVYLNGVLLVRDSDYSATNGTSIASLAALATGDVLEIITFTSFDLATAIQLSNFDAKGDILVASGADAVGRLPVGTNGYFLKANSSQTLGVEWATVDALPSQTGNSGEFLTTDGSTASWAAISQVPSQTGQSGKYLTTDGTTASWAAVPSGGGTVISSGVASGTVSATYSFSSGSYAINQLSSNVISSITVGSETLTSTGIITLTTSASSVSIALKRKWTSRTNINTDYVYPGSFAYGNSTYIMGNSGGTIFSSTDAITWTSRDSGFAFSDIQATTFGNNIFVAVGGSGKLSTSTDGTTWTTRSAQFGTSTIDGITYGNGIFVAVGGAGKISTSTNGVTWTSRTGAGITNLLYDVEYGAGVFVVGAESGLAQSSTDGITWTTRNIAFGGAGDVTAIAFGNSVFVAVGSSSKVSTSTDGITWTTRNFGTTTGVNIQDVQFGNGIFIACTNENNTFNLRASTDGITWTTRDVNITGTSGIGAQAVHASGNLFLYKGAGSYRTAPVTDAAYGSTTETGYAVWEPITKVTAV